MRTPKRNVVRLAELASSRSMSQPACVVGQVIDIDPAGRPIVDFPGNESGPIPARTVVRLDHVLPGTSVLLAFENGHAGAPIILGFPQASLQGPVPQTTEATVESTQSVVVDVKSLTVNAKREIVLRCGLGSVTLRPDGTIVVKGTKLLSRSSGTNKIKGASVNIN